MTIDDAKAIIIEFDRLGLEMREGLNMLTENYLISDHVIDMKDICDHDAKKAIIFLQACLPK